MHTDILITLFYLLFKSHKWIQMDIYKSFQAFLNICLNSQNNHPGLTLHIAWLWPDTPNAW